MTPHAGSNFSRYKIPDNLNPSGICCICVPVPDDRQWHAMFFGALWRLSLQTNWERDDAHSAQIVAAKWREIWTEAQEMACCKTDPSVINIQISNQLVQNMQLAITWKQIWLDATSVVSIAYYAIPATYSTDPGDVGDEIRQREEALCVAVQGFLHEILNYMESYLMANFDEVSQAAGTTIVAAGAVSGLLMWPVLIGWVVAGIIAVQAFYELRRTEYRDYLICRMLENLKGLDPDSRADFEGSLTADPVGRPQPETPQQNVARDLIETYLRSQINNLDNYLMFAGQLGTAMDIAEAGGVDCPCLDFCHEFDFTIDEQGWTAFNAPPLQAAYDAGIGWGNGSGAPPSRHLIQIEHAAFSSRFITSVEFFISTPLIDPGSVMQVRMPNVGGAEFAGGGDPEGATQKLWAVGATGTGLWISCDNAGMVLYTGHITKLIVCGQGTDPF